MQRIKAPSGQNTLENKIFLVLIVLSAMLLRYYLFPIESSDYHQFLQQWYETLKVNGGIAAIGMDIGDYMPPYFYILALLTYLPGNDLFYIKAVSCIADLLLAFYVMRIVDLRYPNRPYGLMAFAVTLFLPTVFLNSAAWGQCDSMFTAALAACLYYLLTDKPNRAVLAFGISLILKLQAVFFAPLLLLLFCKRIIKARSFLLIPAVYLLSILPAAIMGRNLWELLTVYFSQSKLYPQLCMGLPNLYAFLGDMASDPISKAGVIFAGGVILMLLYVLYRKSFVMTREILVTLALLFAILMPFILPHMHERYYYPADILSIVFAFYFKEKLYAAVIMCVTSACAVSNFLFGMKNYPQQLLAIAVLLNLILIFKHLWTLIELNPVEKQMEHTIQIDCTFSAHTEPHSAVKLASRKA